VEEAKNLSFFASSTPSSHKKNLCRGEREIDPLHLLSGLDEVCYTKPKAGEMSENAPTVM
jgi:hypothetical protein